MSFIKALSRKPAAQRFGCWVIAQAIRLAGSTGRLNVKGGEKVEALLREGKPFTVALWHGRLMLLPLAWQRSDSLSLLISFHSDGRILSRTLSHFGIGTISGSSSNGGSEARQAMERTLADGRCVGITPDGPRGPRMRAKAGLVRIAAATGTPILPLGISTGAGKELRSWDRFLVSLPFGPLAVVWGEPIHVPPDPDPATVETFRKQVEDAMSEATREADRLCGRTTPEPEPPAQTLPPGDEETAEGAE
ncbi:MAG: lysophospholipid acyltransferase family protein [Rhodospirillales bacterium]|nr:lysophospholipid acyltransferase family protein [Rhodospirillales bacterium]